MSEVTALDPGPAGDSCGGRTGFIIGIDNKM